METRGKRCPKEQGKPKRREQWAGHCEYILSLFGYLSGSGDFWRFPYLFWTNGGGTFLIAYLLAVCIFSIPVFYLEVTISQYSGKGMYGIWCISPLFSGMAITMFIININSLLIYPTIRLWIMSYIRHSFQSPLPWTTCENSWNTDACADNVIKFHVSNYSVSVTNNSSSVSMNRLFNLTEENVTKKAFMSSEEEFWKYELLKESSGIEEIGSINWELCLYNFVLRGIVVLCVIKSVKSIGKIMYVTTITPFVLLIIVWIRSLTLPGAADGLIAFLKPDLSKLADEQMWMQAGFIGLNTVAIGMGGTLVVGSHGKFNSGVMKSTICACALDVLGTIFASAVLFTVMGVMAAEKSQSLENVISSGTSLGFVGFTKAFSYLPEAQIWTIIFFIATFIALLDIVIITKEVVVEYIQQSVPFLHDRRKTVVLLVFVSSFILSLPFVTQAGPYIFQITEWYFLSWCILFTTIMECIICMWIFGGDRIDQIIDEMIGRPMPTILRFLAAYVCPVICIVFFIISIILYKAPTYGNYHYPYTVVLFGYFLGIIPVLPIPIVMAMKIYKRKGTLKKRILTLLKPSIHWQSSQQSVDYTRTELIKADVAYENRSISNIAYYNLTGRQRKSFVENELSVKQIL